MPTPVPMPSNPDPYGIQRKMDEERMEPTEPPTAPVTVAQVEEILAGNRNTSDGKLATILSGYSLTERVTPARLTRWTTEFTQLQTKQSLIALADGSAFLPLPAGDASNDPAPPIAEQRRIVSAMAIYLTKTLPDLPNLVATRRTVYFEDRPPRQLPPSTDPAVNDRSANRPMHVVATSDSEVTYYQGHEVTEKKAGINELRLDPGRFSTAGEFGPILYGVMLDARQNNLAWAGWTPGAQGRLAVFRFDATQQTSHFSLKPPGPQNPQGRFVAYHGELAVDPADGTIMRISVVARPASSDTVKEASIAVEYDRVEIGGHLYTCPLRAIALSKVPLRKGQVQDSPPLQTQLNDVVFDQFHVFRGDVRILEKAVAQDAAPQP